MGYDQLLNKYLIKKLKTNENTNLYSVDSVLCWLYYDSVFNTIFKCDTNVIEYHKVGCVEWECNNHRDANHIMKKYAYISESR